MKLTRHYKITIVLSVILFLICIAGCKDRQRIIEPKDGPAHLVTSENRIYLDSIVAGSGIIERDILLINDGGKALTITGPHHYCSCTHAEIANKSILSGHGEKMKIFLNTDELTPGEFIRTIDVISTGGTISVDLMGKKVNK